MTAMIAPTTAPPSVGKRLNAMFVGNHVLFTLAFPLPIKARQLRLGFESLKLLHHLVLIRDDFVELFREYGRFGATNS